MRDELYVRAVTILEEFKHARSKYRNDQTVHDAIRVSRSELLKLIGTSRKYQYDMSRNEREAGTKGFYLYKLQTQLEKEDADTVRVPASLVVGLYREQELYTERLWRKTKAAKELAKKYAEKINAEVKKADRSVKPLVDKAKLHVK